MKTRMGMVLCTVAIAGSSACGSSGGDVDDDGSGGPLACTGIPDECGEAQLDEQGTEYQDRATAECLYQVLESGEPAHIRVVWRDLKVVTWDLYIDASEDPPVLASEDCEIDGACQGAVFKRCKLYSAADLDCAAEGETPRVCDGPINWCNSSIEVEETCP